MVNYIEDIIETPFDLLDFASRENESPELLMDYLVEEGTDDGSSISERVLEEHHRANFSKEGEFHFYVNRSGERIFTRRKILDALIEQTGGSSTLRKMNLRQFVLEGDDTTRRILTSVVSEVVRLYMDNETNHAALKGIEASEIFQSQYDFFDGNVKNYFVEEVAKNLEIY